MRCQQLLHLLNATSTPNEDRERVLIEHLRTCPLCHRGLIKLSQALLAEDALSCDQCRLLLPSYYEATRPDHPLVYLSAQQLREILLHLGHCTSCQQDYTLLVSLSELEEEGMLGE